jgi:hypothetical protein
MVIKSTRREPASTTTMPSKTTIGVWGTAEDVVPATTTLDSPPIQRMNSKGRLSIKSLSGSPSDHIGGAGGATALTNNGATLGIHPLKYSWDLSVSHRSSATIERKSNNTSAKKDDASGKEKETREDWEGAVVRLGGFSSVRLSLL